MRIALTGCSGFIGSVTAQTLVEHGHSVVGLVRETSRRDHVAPYIERFVVGTQDAYGVWDQLLEGCDCVIHNSVDWTPLRNSVDLNTHLQSNLVASLRLLHAAQPRQFVFVSTVAVHHDMRPRWAGTIDEDHPLRPAGLYGAYKAAVEAHLWAAHFGQGQHTCALRPCAVYGIDPKLDRTIGHPIVERIRDEQHYDRSGGGKFVHVDDVAAAIAATIGNDRCAGKAYNLVDCYARWGDLAKFAAEALGIDAKIDLSSPEKPQNEFDVASAREDLRVAMDRGQDGLRLHMNELAQRMQRSATSSAQQG